MKSLNQIIAELETFANAHYQIHTFGHGDVWEIAPNSSEIVYPVLWFVPQGATTGLREVTNNFTVLCMDLVRSGEENETEVLSDTLQIILDIVSYYRQQHGEAYIVEFGSNIQPFTERDPDMLSGHSITVSIRQPFNYSECAIPFSAAPTPITPTCSPATIQNAASNPTYQASIASGDNLVLPQVKILDSDGITPILANYIPESDGFVAECSTTCADGTVENSDQTVTVTVGSGDTETFPDTPISANSDLVINQPSGVAKDLVVRYETQGVAPTTIVSGEVVVPDAELVASVIVEVYSDSGFTTPITTTTYNQTVYIRATPSNTTPTGYVFFAFDGVNIFPIGQQVSNEISGEVPFLGSYDIYANTLGTETVYGSKSLTGSSDPDALLYINAHNAASSLTMADSQQLVVNETYAKFKGARTTNNSNLWSKLSGDNAEIYPFTPVSNSVTSLPTIAVDMVNPSTLATIVNFLSTDVEVDGVTANSTKWLVLKNQPSDFGQDDVGADVYYKTSSTRFGMYVGAYNGNMSNGVFFSPEYCGANNNNNYSNSNLPRAIGLLSINRDNAANFQLYNRGVEILSIARVSTTPPSLPFFGFASNRDGSPDTSFGRKFQGKLAMVANRPSFTDDELSDWNEIWEYYTANIIL